MATMSDDDEDRTCIYGTALPELPADVIPTKKPITVADQIAVDANGKRRFHGAFTGGFSAGFWNTVGSLEGWQPKEFKSSRSEKAQRLTQAPTDFMDDEDMGEFGIAPQRIQTTEDFTASASDKDSRKRSAAREEDGPVLGTPVLQLFLKPAKDKASVSLLKKMGWREQQGIGSRLTRNEKKKAAERYLKERGGAKVYNCDMGPLQKPHTATDGEEEEEETESEDSDEEITFAPDDYEPFLHAFKTNRFGLGYEGLSKTSGTVTQKHINLFSTFEVLDRKNKKLSIKGQAFGVGAFEEDDDDIYAKDDMTNYDFKLGEKSKTTTKKQPQTQSANVIEGFAVSNSHQKRMNKKIYTVDVPSSFTPRNWAMRKTRFGPAIVQPSSPPTNEGHKRHILTAEERGQLLNEKPNTKEIVPRIDVAVPTVAPEVIVKIEPEVATLPERKALNFIKLPDSLNFDRFVSEKDLVVVKEEKVKVEPKKVEVKRTKSTWLPCSLLYEKMNIAEPSGGSRNKNNKGSGSFSLFQCLSETTKNRKKTYKERPDFTDVFTKAQEADIDILHTKANVISLAPNPTTSSTIIHGTPTQSTPPPPLPTQSTPPPPPLPTANLPKSKPVEIPTTKNKSHLELKSLSMEAKHPSEKKDLFKAIFDSDDDDDDAETPVESTLKTSNVTEIPLEPRPSVRGDFAPKPATILNVLRNSSPPRGIFSNMFKTTKENVEKLPERKSPEKDQLEEKANFTEPVSSPPSLLYGPALPVSVTIPTTSVPMTNSTSMDFQFGADEWIEKSQASDRPGS
ncbi:G patch domain-containing protein 1 like [Pseudolycoriella hygida]|uniref:G patch domain-containing protein 1 like n=1 Tax=Pseudolycoriella hygida TaxID=35572 RepID=A0A9Q0S651_9DIPT|nr:G patch domain-containing protein 1 like [Pseudolycoriella hygida]